MLPIDAGNFALHLEEAESHLQEGHLVFSSWMEQLPPCLHGSEHRGHGEGFLSHTQHMVDPQHMAHTCSPSTQCGEAGQQGPRTRPAGKKGDGADLQDCLCSSLRHNRKTRTGGPACSLGMGENHLSGLKMTNLLLKTFEYGAQAS